MLIDLRAQRSAAPYNLVFRDGGVVGAIDFYAASPGPRAWDLAYLAYRLVPLTAPGNVDGIAARDEQRAARLRRLCGASGGVAAADVVDVVPRRLDELAAFTADRLRRGGVAPGRARRARRALRGGRGHAPERGDARAA